MLKPKGGRGQKAPYTTAQMRVPVPIKAQVQDMIDRYRDEVLKEEESSLEAEIDPVYEACLKLVDSFIEEKEQGSKLHQRNNINLVRFRDWLEQKTRLK